MRFDENFFQTIMKHNLEKLHEPHSYLYEKDNDNISDEEFFDELVKDDAAGDIIATRTLAMYFWDQKDYLTAFDYLQVLVERKEYFFYVYQGILYYKHPDTPNDYTKALDLFLTYYQHVPKDGEVANTIGDMYKHGYGCATNTEQAIEWYKRAAELGEEGAALSIAHIYAHGWHGVKKDPEEAKKWLTKVECSRDPEILEQARRLLKDIEDDDLIDLSDDII